MLKDYERKLHINKDVPRKQLDKWLDESLQKEIIEPVSEESTDWVSGLVVAP